MIRDFRNQVAVITGAASGIGAALAEGFAGEGMRVVAADIDAAGARRTAQRIGGDALGVEVDVAQEASVAALAATAFDAFGQVDLLINNAGVFQGGLSWERSADDWEWTFGVNVFGIVHAIHEPGDLLPAAHALAGRLAKGSRTAMAQAKRLIDTATQGGQAQMVEAELAAQIACRDTEFHRQAVRRFASKSPALYNWDAMTKDA